MNLSQSKNQSQNNIIHLPLRWHITTNCSNHCKHCYMYEEKIFKNERKNTLPLKGLIKILDDLKKFEEKYNAKFVRITLSGGDPLLREDAFEFFREIRRRDIKIALMGNPETLDEKTVVKLKDLDVSSFQMSLDGLEQMHDSFRSKGSFQRTIEKTQLLKEHGICCKIMFTLYPINAGELIPLMNFLAKNAAVNAFSFGIGCFVGEGKNLSERFSSKEVHKIFTEYLEHKFLLEKEYDIKFFEESKLFKILRLEKGLMVQNFTNKTSVISGCLAGWNPPVILADGTMLACRNLPMAIGKMPESSFEDIFLNNAILKKFRRRFFFEGCRDCDLYSVCRGCPSYVYSLTENPFAKNSLCFRNDIKNKQMKTKRPFVEPDLNTTKEEEWAYVKAFHLFGQNYFEHFKNKDCQYAYLELAQSRSEKEKFLKNPDKFIKDKNYNLSKSEISWLIYKCGEYLIHENYNIQLDGIAKYAAENIINDIYVTEEAEF